MSVEIMTTRLPGSNIEDNFLLDVLQIVGSRYYHL